MTETIMRPFVVADTAAIAALAQACGLPDAPAPADEQHALCAVAADEAIIGCAWIELDTSMQHEQRAFLHGMVHPQFQRQGIGTRLLEWQIARAGALLRQHETQRPSVLRIDFFHEQPGVRALYEQHGFQFAFAEDTMHRALAPLPAQSLPPNIAAVPWTAERAAQFFAAYAASFRERPGFPGWDQATWQHNLTGEPAFLPDCSLLLLHEDTAVGFAVCEDYPHGTGHVMQMGVHPDWRRRGLAGALLAEVVRRFSAAGLAQAELEVNANNPGARRVYERLGFTHAKRFFTYRKLV